MPTPQQTSSTALNIDVINRETWKLPSTVRDYERLEGWTDPGEQAAVDHVAAEMRSKPILDIGVGAGRTTGILQAISTDYIGIDYTLEMVDACRSKHPHARIFHRDARDLSAFADDQFALVVFSFNGIDSIDFADRQKTLREVYRVLQPGGLFIVSGHNRDGPGYAEKPRLQLCFSWNPLKLGWRVLQLARSIPRSYFNRRQFSAFNESHTEWALVNCAAHDFGIVAMYTTFNEQKQQLKAAGFETEQVWDNVSGNKVTDGQDVSQVWWFHYLARKI